MFVGHYGPALAGPRFVKAVPVWALCVAVQFLDYLWGVFVYFGIERVRIEPGFTGQAVEQVCADYPEHHRWEERNLFFGGILPVGQMHRA